MPGGRGGGCCVGSVTHSVPLLLGGGGGGVAKGMLPCLLVPKREPAHGLHPRFVLADIWADRERERGGGGGSHPTLLCPWAQQ